MSKLIDLTDQKFGQLVVIERDEDHISTSGRKRVKWICQCSCGNIISVKGEYLRDKWTTRCKTCRYKDSQLNGYISYIKIQRIKYSAKKRNIPLDETIINKEYLWDLYLKQNKKCSLSGVDIKFAMSGKDENYRRGTTASLDRIDNTKGYIKNNIQWVHKHINSMKYTHTNKDFINICKEITLHNKNNIINTTSENNKDINKYKIIRLARIKRDAKKRNIYFHPELTHSFLYKLYLDQNKKCILTGRSIYLAQNRKEILHNTASLDRINSSKEYTKSNIQWLHKDINIMKWDLEQNYFLACCEKVAILN